MWARASIVRVKQSGNMSWGQSMAVTYGSSALTFIKNTLGPEVMVPYNNKLILFFSIIMLLPDGNNKDYYIESL